MQVSEFRRLFSYHRWANAEALKSLKMIETPPSKALSIFAHIIAADRLWYERIQNGGQKIAVWPPWSIHQCETESNAIDALFLDYLDGLDDSKLNQTISYVNFKGEFHTSAGFDILQHIIMHGAYHRGQIALAIRQSGHTPPYTDFIHAVRSGLVE